MNVHTVGMVGLGNMGGRITRRLTAAGLRVVGHDTREGAAEQAGAVPAPSLAEVAEQAEVLLLSLPDSGVVESVVLGDVGLLAHCRPGQVVVDLSTASPTSTRRLHDLLAERKVELLDAGISGGAAAAEKGTLTLMVGGSAEVLEGVRPVLEPFSAKVLHMGETGSGHTTKLLNNFLNAVSLAATAEVMVAGKRAGLDLHVLLDVLNASSGVNFATLNRFPRIVDGDYLEGGLSGRLMMKDVVLYVERLRELGVPSLNASGPMSAFGLAAALGYADSISNRVVDAIGDVAGGVRLHNDAEQKGQ
ncbi:MAG TPA: NAD(P)-dependent oxidoreductase [Nocardioidaceae bacterium]|nr:NAD(P)-dependent oxidoreductase [Nocardioidaceae bacterium]